MLWTEDGPWLLFRRIRAYSGVGHDEEGNPIAPYGSIFACLGCLSVWVALLLWFLPRGVSAILAVSTVAILVQNMQERVSR